MLDIIKRYWKPVVFVVLEVFFIAWLGIILGVLIIILLGSDPLELLAVFVADIAFLVVGILLLVLGRYYHISLAGRIMPFIAMVVLTAVAVNAITVASLWFATVATAILILVSLVIAFRTLVPARKT